MNNNDFVTFNSYHDKNILEETLRILKNENIECIIEDNSTTFDPLMSNTETIKDYRIKIKSIDFQKATLILEKFMELELEKIPKDYYLMDFSDKELYDVIKKRDEWGSFDVSLAKKLLMQKGKEVSEVEENNMRAERILELSKPEVSSNFWIVIGYISAFLGGPLGIMIGVGMLSYKKTLPNGQKVNGYTESQRWHGMIITIIGIVCLILFIINLLFDTIAKLIDEIF